MWFSPLSVALTRASFAAPFNPCLSALTWLVLKRKQSPCVEEDDPFGEEANWRIQGPTVILGSNGTGKSSTLAMLAGHLTPNSGVLSFSLGEKNQISPDAWMTQIALAAPWAEVPSHLTLAEAIAFHGTFRQPRKATSIGLHFSRGLGLMLVNPFP